MEFSEIKDAESRDFELAMELYSAAFPLNERHPVSVIKERVKQGSTRVFAGRSGMDIVFIALLWPLKNTEFILLDYMATSPGHRSKSIGSLFLQSMRKVLEEENKYFILEVEDPEHGENKEERVKRLSFYKKNGARELEKVKYILPALQGSAPTEMILMIFPEYGNGKIDASLVRDLIIQIYEELYNRDARDTVLRNWPFSANSRIELI